MSLINTTNPIFDTTFGGTCVSSSFAPDPKGDLAKNIAKATAGDAVDAICNTQMVDLSDNKKKLMLVNVSNMPGPSVWVPGKKNKDFTESCVMTDTKATCISYPLKIDQNYNKSEPVIQQTFSKSFKSNNAPMWIQDYPPEPMPIISNPTGSDMSTNNLVNIINKDQLELSPFKYGDDNSKIPIPGSPTKVKYPNTSTIAPYCVITTPNCTITNFTDNCNISCPTIDKSKKLNYTYNQSYNLWLEPTENNMIKGIISKNMSVIASKNAN